MSLLNLLIATQNIFARSAKVGLLLKKGRCLPKGEHSSDVEESVAIIESISRYVFGNMPIDPDSIKTAEPVKQ